MTLQTNSRYKLIALDMDGTLLNRKGEISEQNRKWIQAALDADIKVILATSRSIRGVVEHARTLNLDLPVIVSNASEVWRTPDELLSRYEFNAEVKERILKVIKEYNGHIRFYIQYVGGQFNHDQWDPELAWEKQWLQVAIKSDDGELLDKIREEISSWGLLDICSSHYTNIECNPAGRSKGSGLLEVCNLFDIRMEEVIAVGDSLNDVSMIRAAGLGIAMGNAQEVVKQAADEITLSNEEDGVAAVIQRYFF